MSESFWSPAHAEWAGMILIPVLSGIAYIIYKQGANQKMIDTMWAWFTNHGSNITGYKKENK